ncbi:MAG: cyclic nucleotide-binding domain-containing protein [Spirochaetaceae bacterium]|jgi:CRP-like cAMP-binding protein|nr:cyclic nucleotide-binding domain-containing protein [Spirochaetaceae bacterium]
MPIDETFSIVNFPRGATISTPTGMPSERFYVIRSGKVRVSSTSKILFEGRERLEQGDFFSVAATLARRPSSITAVAETDVTLMEVSKVNFAVLIDKNLPVSTKILKYLSARLRILNEELIYGKIEANHEPDLSHLYNFAIYFLKRNIFRSAYCAFYQYLKYCPDGSHTKKAKEYVDKLASYALGIRFDFDDRDITRAYPIDSAIFFEGEPSTGMFIIRKGSIKIIKIVDDKEVTLAVLKSGDIMGEMGLIDSKPRSATAIACEDCEIMSIANTAYLPILKDGVSITEKICVTLSKRICAMQDRLNGVKLS